MEDPYSYYVKLPANWRVFGESSDTVAHSDVPIGGASSFSHGKAIGAGADSPSSDSRPASSLCPDEVCGYLLMRNPMVRFTMVSARSRSKDVLQ